MSDPFATQRLDDKVLLITATEREHRVQTGVGQMVTASVIDFDQTVHGPYGEHVAA
jgi:hypothetical protein